MYGYGLGVYWEDYNDPEEDPQEVHVVVLEDTTHTARKRHSCEKCPLGILPGETYRKQVYIYEGEMTVNKSHLGRCWIEKKDCLKCNRTFDCDISRHSNQYDFEDDFSYTLKPQCPDCRLKNERVRNGCTDCDPDCDGIHF